MSRQLNSHSKSLWIMNSFFSFIENFQFISLVLINAVVITKTAFSINRFQFHKICIWFLNLNLRERSMFLFFGTFFQFYTIHWLTFLGLLKFPVIGHLQLQNGVSVLSAFQHFVGQNQWILQKWLLFLKELDFFPDLLHLGISLRLHTQTLSDCKVTSISLIKFIDSLRISTSWWWAWI